MFMTSRSYSNIPHAAVSNKDHKEEACLLLDSELKPTA